MTHFPLCTDIGTPRHAGSAAIGEDGTVTLTGGGQNMWFAHDAFHFAGLPASGDLSLSADIAFVGVGNDPHRKACLMVRQSLDPDAVCAYAALHGDGLTSLQFRSVAGENTHEIQVAATGPRRLRLEKRGRTVRLFVGDALAFSGAAATVDFDEAFYVGLGVCAHDDDTLETAVFSNVAVSPLPPPESDTPGTLHSTLEVQSIASTDRRVVHTAADHFEAPNWMPEGDALLINRAGRLWTVPVAGGALHPLETGFASRCNNDHGISPDGTRIVISDHSQERGQSLIYTLPIGGGAPTRITPLGPSYWHGWSPDGETLVYCAERGGQYDIYAIPADGSGPEVRLTDAPGLDDGPEFSPDGRFVYFNSERTGRMQIWRMRPDGSEQERVIVSERNDWFAHPSPDGHHLVYLSYGPEVTGHPPEKAVELRLMDIASGTIRTLARLYGGQGTLNVPCWSPDSRHIAFVSYQRVP